MVWGSFEVVFLLSSDSPLLFAAGSEGSVPAGVRGGDCIGCTGPKRGDLGPLEFGVGNLLLSDSSSREQTYGSEDG